MKLERKWRENFPIKNCCNFFALHFSFCNTSFRLQTKNETFYAHIIRIASVETCSDFKALIYFMTNIKIAEMPCSQMTCNESHSIVVNNKFDVGFTIFNIFFYLVANLLSCLHSLPREFNHFFMECHHANAVICIVFPSKCTEPNERKLPFHLHLLHNNIWHHTVCVELIVNRARKKNGKKLSTFQLIVWCIKLNINFAPRKIERVAYICDADLMH